MARSSVIMEMTGEEAKLVQSYQNAMRQNQRFKQELTDLARTGRQTRDSFGGFDRKIKAAFSPQAIATFAGALAGTAGGLSVVSAFQRVVSLAGEARTEVKEFAEGLTETYGAAKALWTLSEGREAYADLTRSQRLAMANEGIGRQEAGDLLFNLKSLGKEEALPEISKAARFMDPETAAKYYTTAASDLSYGEDAGTPQQVLSGLLAGAEASKFNPDETADWVVRMAPKMAAFETSHAEMLAVGASISEAAADQQILATYMTAGHKSLAKWKAEAIQAGKEQAADEPEAPEKPEYKPPEKPERIYSSIQAAQNAELSHRDRLTAYDERHADDMAEYQEKEAKYQEQLADWKKKEVDRARLAEAAAGAHGFVETFEAMRQSDPKAYQEARLGNVRFEAFAAAFEQGLPKALKMEPKIDAEIQAAQLYQTKVDDRPRQLTEQQQLQIAKTTNELANEARAEEENRLSMAIEYNKALAAATGQSQTLTKGWEKVLEAGATMAGTREATHEATEAIFDAMARRRPELYEKHLDQFEPVEYKTTRSGRMLPENVNIQLEQITPEIRDAVQAAMRELITGRVDARHTADAAEAAQPIVHVQPVPEVAVPPTVAASPTPPPNIQPPPPNPLAALPPTGQSIVAAAQTVPLPQENRDVVAGLKEVVGAVQELGEKLETPDSFLGSQILGPLTDPENN